MLDGHLASRWDWDCEPLSWGLAWLNNYSLQAHRAQSKWYCWLRTVCIHYRNGGCWPSRSLKYFKLVVDRWCGQYNHTWPIVRICAICHGVHFQIWPRDIQHTRLGWLHSQSVPVLVPEFDRASSRLWPLWDPCWLRWDWSHHADSELAWHEP